MDYIDFYECFITDEEIDKKRISRGTHYSKGVVTIVYTAETRSMVVKLL
jgi:hypothetical protein